MQIKFTIRYHYIPNRKAIIKSQAILRDGEGIQIPEPSVISGRSSETATLGNSLVVS